MPEEFGVGFYAKQWHHGAGVDPGETSIAAVEWPSETLDEANVVGKIVRIDEKRFVCEEVLSLGKLKGLRVSVYIPPTNTRADKIDTLCEVLGHNGTPSLDVAIIRAYQLQQKVTQLEGQLRKHGAVQQAQAHDVNLKLIPEGCPPVIAECLVGIADAVTGRDAFVLAFEGASCLIHLLTERARMVKGLK